MTIEELLAWATSILFENHIPACERRAAQAVIDHLGVSLPCGWESPYVAGPEVVLVVDDRKVRLGVEEARGVAAALLRSADDAEATT